MKTVNLPQVALDRLVAYDTPTVCNAIELFEVRPRNSGFMDARIRACFPEMPPVAGYAATASFRVDAPALGDAYASLDAQVAALEQSPGQAMVVFQDLDDPAVGATFGEVMCSAYKAFGAVGLITSGAGRDLEQVRELGFPVYTNGSICSHGHALVPSVQIPVRVGGITIFPGDLLHADRNGITTVPPEIAPELPDACAEFIKAEEVVLAYMRGGQVNLKDFSQARQESQNQIQKLRRRISRKR